MTPIEHLERHRMLHSMLDELCADFVEQTRKLPSKTTVMELILWSNHCIKGLEGALKPVENVDC